MGLAGLVFWPGSLCYAVRVTQPIVLLTLIRKKNELDSSSFHATDNFFFPSLLASLPSHTLSPHSHGFLRPVVTAAAAATSVVGQTGPPVW